MKALIFNNIVEETAETEFPVSPEMTWMDCTYDCKSGWLLEDGVLIAPPPIPTKTYDLLRVAEYPPIIDQLDMQFHDWNTWKDTIQAVKDKYPKG